MVGPGHAAVWAMAGLLPRAMEHAQSEDQVQGWQAVCEKRELPAEHRDNASEELDQTHVTPCLESGESKNGEVKVMRRRPSLQRLNGEH